MLFVRYAHHLQYDFIKYSFELIHFIIATDLLKKRYISIQNEASMIATVDGSCNTCCLCPSIEAWTLCTLMKPKHLVGSQLDAVACRELPARSLCV